MRLATLTATLLAATALVTQAQADAFNRIASFHVPQNLPDGMDVMTETSAEIIDASDDGMTLVYSDSPLGAIGFIDIADPANPQAGGAVMMDGEPTSVVVSDGTVYVAINTSESFTNPSGLLKLVDVQTREVTDSCDLGGQPDSTAIAPDGSFLAIAIENERDEDLNDGLIPQLPAGFVAIIPLDDGVPDCDGLVQADVTGLAEVAGEDPEPEFVDINENGDIAVTLQENNHIVVLASDGSVKSHFSAGEVTLEGIDIEEEGAITFTETLMRKREPDAVKWLGADRIVTANEGDYEGGSRGFTIFNTDGTVAYESGADFEYAVARAGHYPEERSGNKGVEPEGLAVGTFGGMQHIFVLSERGSIIGIYADGETPELVGLIPSGIGPEGAVSLEDRGLLAVANEADLGADGGPRSHVMIFEYQDAEPQYPTIEVAEDADVMAFGALSGLTVDPQDPTTLYAVNDSFYRLQPTIFTIDASQSPAQITDALRVTRSGMPAQKLDLEGIVSDGGGGFWLASEGRTDRLTPHGLYRVGPRGEIVEEVAFPSELLSEKRRFGAEGIVKIGERLWIALQREWADDPEGLVKLVSYDLGTGDWGAVHYPLDSVENGWIGLSDMAVHDEHVYFIERDNQIDELAAVKQITRVALSEMEPATLGSELPVVEKDVVRDLLPDLRQWHGFVVDKVEGLAISPDSTAFIVTDNDGTDGSSGETFFWSVDLQ